jgi:hypothetical protein
MVSQRSMHQTFVPSSWLLWLVVVAGLGAGCGQNEGGRCQVNSDCASGLVCLNGSSGNGECQRPGGRCRGLGAEQRSGDSGTG